MEFTPDNTRQWLYRCAVVGGGYVVLSILCALIAWQVPEVNVPIWAPAGFAFAALLIWGYRCWPGVWLGAWLAEQLFNQDASLSVLDILLPTAATLQALLGVWLVNCVSRKAGRPQSASRVALWITCAAPLPCGLFAVAAGMSIAGDFSVFSPQQSMGGMLSWWSGNSLGVMLVGPLIVYLWPDQPFRRLDIAKPVVLTLSFTAFAILGSHYWLSAAKLQSEQALTREKLSHVLPEASALLPDWVQQLAFVERFLESSEHVTHDELVDFTSILQGASPLSYIDIVGAMPALDRPDDLRALTLSQSGKLVAMEGAARYPILASIPLSGDSEIMAYSRQLSREVVGFDHWSRPARRRAMQQVMATGRTHLARDTIYRFMADGSPDSTQGYLAFQPVYGRDAKADNVVGFVVGVYTLGDFFSAITAAARRENVHLRIVEEDGGAALVETAPAVLWPAHILIEQSLELDGLGWRVQVAPLNFTAFDRDSSYRQALMFTSMIFAFIMLFSALTASGEALRLRDEVKRKTASLRQKVGQLRQARDDAESANLAKSRFLATVSHEIRTPMNGVLGMVDVLKGTALNRYQRDMLTTVDRSAKLLLSLIDDILDFSKIEAERLELELSPFDPALMVQGVVDSMTETAYRKNVTIQVQCADTASRLIIGDETRIRQILFNLLGNAVKFSQKRGDERGRVAVRYRVADAPSPKLEITVIDNGIGIRAGDKDKLFNPFTQAESSTTRDFGGTGLGLAICKRLVDLMGGEIDFDSEPGHGTRFTVAIPTRIEQAVQRSVVVSRWQRAVIVDSPEIPSAVLQAWFVEAGLSAEIQPDLAAAGARMAGLQEACLVYDCGNEEPDLQALRRYLPSGLLPCTIAITRGRRRLPRRHRSGLITLDQLTRDAFVEALRLLDIETGEFCAIAHIDDTPQPRPDRPLDNPHDYYCLLIGEPSAALAGSLNALREKKQLEVVTAPDWPQARDILQRDRRRAVVIEDSGDDELSLDALRRRYIDFDNVKNLVITRGRRKQPRYDMQDAISIDLEALSPDTLTEGVRLASAMLSERLNNTLNPDSDDPKDSEAENCRVLVVEDDATNRRVIQAQLTQCGIRAHYAENGTAGLAYWREQRYPLVITDIHMPQMDGYEMARHIRAEEDAASPTRIIALSANASRDEKARATAKGVDAYLVKPTTGQRLLDTIGQLAPALVPEARPQAQRQQAESADIDSEIDLAVQRQVIGDDAELLQELALDYLASSRAQLAELGRLIDQGDLAAAAETAHKLKSSSRAIGASGLGDQLENFEQAVAAMSGSAAGAALTTLKARHQRVVNALQRQLGLPQT